MDEVAKLNAILVSAIIIKLTTTTPLLLYCTIAMCAERAEREYICFDFEVNKLYTASLFSTVVVLVVVVVIVSLAIYLLVPTSHKKQSSWNVLTCIRK